MVINSFFTRSGDVATGLTPVISIWSMAGTVRTPVIVAQPTIESGNGFYSYNFVSYDKDLDYTVMVDAGPAMTVYGRYNVASITPQAAVAVDGATVEQITSGVWDAAAINHTIPGSTGEMLNHIKADTGGIAVAITTIDALLHTLQKYERNRTKIDVSAKTLTVYDDDKVTPIVVFDLKDSAGAASVAEVAERNPR